MFYANVTNVECFVFSQKNTDQDICWLFHRRIRSEQGGPFWGAGLLRAVWCADGEISQIGKRMCNRICQKDVLDFFWVFNMKDLILSRFLKARLSATVLSRSLL